MVAIEFTVIGKPQSKGAHTSFVPKRKDGSYATFANGRPKVVTKDSNAEQESAQAQVAFAALNARHETGQELWAGAVEVNRVYYFTRGVGHYGTGRNARVLKERAPYWPITKADIDKLDRLLFDALTGTVIRDDNQIVGGWHQKRYAEGDEPPRVEVTVRLLERQTVGTVVADDQLALAAAA